MSDNDCDIDALLDYLDSQCLPGYRKALTSLVGERDALAAEIAALKKAKTRRKVVQLIVLPKKDHYWNELYALADDGTIWQRYEPNGWSQTLDIPQSEQEVQP
jgi:hypothetical protein